MSVLYNCVLHVCVATYVCKCKMAVHVHRLRAGNKFTYFVEID